MKVQVDSSKSVVTRENAEAVTVEVAAELSTSRTMFGVVLVVADYRGQVVVTVKHGDAVLSGDVLTVEPVEYTRVPVTA
jgi:hypothetical protein